MLYLSCLFTYRYRHTVYVAYYIHIMILYMCVIFVCNSCLCIPYICLYPYFSSCAKCGISWHISYLKNKQISIFQALGLSFFEIFSNQYPQLPKSKYFFTIKNTAPFSKHKKHPIKTTALFYKKHRGERQHPSWRIRRYLPSGLGRGDHLALRGGSKSVLLWVFTIGKATGQWENHRKTTWENGGYWRFTMV